MVAAPNPELTATVQAVHGALAAAPQPPVNRYAVATEAADNLTSSLTVRGHEVTVGQTAPLGDDEGPSPVELVLGALGSCQEVVIGVHARLLGIPVSSVRVEVSGDLDPRGFFGAADVPVGFSEVRYTVHIESDADADKLAELISRAERLCPVTAIIAEPTPVVPGYVVNGVPHEVAVAA